VDDSGIFLGAVDTDTIRGIKVQKGELGDSVRDISKGISRSVDVSSDISEKKRDKMIRVDKK
jgi:hypothetical protein